MVQEHIKALRTSIERSRVLADLGVLSIESFEARTRSQLAAIDAIEDAIARGNPPQRLGGIAVPLLGTITGGAR